METWAEPIYLLMKQNKVTIADVAHHLGFTREYISKTMHGKTNMENAQLKITKAVYELIKI